MHRLSAGRFSITVQEFSHTRPQRATASCRTVASWPTCTSCCGAATHMCAQ